MPDGTRQDADHICFRIFNKCANHQGLDGQPLMQNCINEDRKISNVKVFMLDNTPSIQQTKTTVDGTQYIDFKDGVKVSWIWSGQDDQRILTITVQGFTFTPSQLNQIQTFCDNKFGVGKVILQ